MKSPSRYLESTKSGIIPALWLLLGLLWMALLALYATTRVDTFEGFHNAHLVLLGYLVVVLLTLRVAISVDVSESMLLTYGVGYSVFHFGIVPIYVLAPKELENLGFNLSLWYTDAQTVMAAYYSAAVFLAGFCTALLFPMRPSHRHNSEVSTPIDLSKLAFFSFVLSVLAWAAIVLSAGFGGYDLLLEGLTSSGRGGVIGVVHTAIGLNFVFSVIDPRTRRKALLLYGVWALFAFPIGLRGEVAFPALVAFGILASQGVVRVDMTRIIAIAVLFFALSSAVAVTRISTSNASFLGSVSVANGLAELGGSIRPSYEVVRWLESGDLLRMGETYYAPFERLFLTIFPLWERLPASDDFRLMNVLIAERAGPYGFSISAEALFNFGHAGVAVVGLLTGLVMRRFGRVAMKGRLPILMTVIGFALFFHIRQAFMSTWSVAFFGLLVVGTLYLVNYARAGWHK